MSDKFGKSNDISGNSQVTVPAPSPVEKPPRGGKEGIVQFIDVSRYQPNMNWDAVVKAGFQAAVAKCVDGATGVDEMFAKHCNAAKAKGLPFGAYCFNRFHTDPVAQAEHFVRHAWNHTHWLVADIEFDKSKSTQAKFGHNKYAEQMDDYAADHSEKFLRRIFQMTGTHAWIYLNRYHFVGFKNPERFAQYPCWISNYSQKTVGALKGASALDVSKVPLPPPFKKAKAWQWTSSHPAAKAITGDANNLDANIYWGSVEDLRKLAGVSDDASD